MQKTMVATERQIELLRECRTCLIADVVTGKLDLRLATIHLPNEDDALQCDGARGGTLSHHSDGEAAP